MKPICIIGEYYTVNPMTIRSASVFFGDNEGTVIPMVLEVLGEFLIMIAVSTIMVESIVLSCKEGHRILE